MDNNNFSPLEAGMKASTSNVNKDKSKDTQAEDLLAKVASILFWVSTIGFCILIITGFVMMMHGASVSKYSDEAKYSIIGLITIIASIFLYLFNIIVWANLKVKVNISRNLFVIKNLMLEDNGKNPSKEESSGTE